jgi:TonB-dependent starch-binding outer membrane protein SusC
MSLMMAGRTCTLLLAAAMGASGAQAQRVETRIAPPLVRTAYHAPAARPVQDTERTITLHLESVPLEAALREVARQAGVRLTYSRESLEGTGRVSVRATDVGQAAAFAMVLSGTDLQAVASAPGRVTIARRTASPPPAPDARVAQQVEEASLSARTVSTHLPISAPVDPAIVGTIRGRVTEAGSGRGLAGAQIVVASAGRSAVTSVTGDYVLVGLPAGAHTVRASLIGYGPMQRSVQLADGQGATADFVLSQAALQLDAVVVTGTPGTSSRREVGNAVTTVNAADVTDKTTINSVQELLQAQAPGVTVLASSGTPGSAGTIQIRGQGSLSAGLQPVVYVDGVRVHSGAAGSFRNDWRQASQPMTRQTGAPGAAYGSGQEASSLSMLNPEDIESIEVIKGPAAATLYGAEAANGVIQIITKRGRLGNQPLQWNARMQFGQTDWALDRVTNHTTCTQDRIDARQPNGDPVFTGCQGVAANSVITATPLALPGVLREGALSTMALSVRGGGENYSFFANLNRDREDGIERNSHTGRTSARANFHFAPTTTVDFNVNFNYIRDETQFPQGNNAGNLIESAWSFVPGASGLSRNQLTDNFGAESDAFAVYENWLRGDRLIFGTTINYRPAPWFTNRLTMGGDIGTRESERWIAPGSRWGPVEGQLTQGSPRNTLYTFDYAGTVRARITPRLASALSFGAQYSNSEYSNTVAQGTGFPSAQTRAIRFATNNNGWTELSEVSTLGFFGQETVEWQDRLFVTAALRMDNSSVFGDDIESIFYPKVSASWVISEEPFFQALNWVDELRLRAAWGQAGNAPGPFAAVRTFTFVETTDPLTGAKGVALIRNTAGNPDVRPERGSEIELGFDAGFLDNRLGAEVTYYNKTTRDALIPVPLPPSEGYVVPTYLANIGEINNRGLEVALTAIPIQSRTLTWDTRIGLSSNVNKLVDYGQDNPAVPFGLTAAVQRNIEGYSLAGYWVRDPVLRAGGNAAVPGDYEGGELRYLGSAIPTRSASLSNTFQIFERVRLFTLFDYKGGNYLYNHTRQRRCALGVCQEVNDPSVSAEERARLQAEIQTNTALYTEDASFIKVRDVSLTYLVPTNLARRMGTDRVSVTVAGHNLGFLYKPYRGLDPETNFVGINDPGAEWAGVRADYWNQPMLRRFSVALDLTF